MKVLLSIVFGLATLLGAAGARAQAPKVGDKVGDKSGGLEALVRAFALDDAHSRRVAFAQFDAAFPVAARPDGLAALWDAVEGKETEASVRANVLIYMAEPRGRNGQDPVIWTPALADDVKRATGHIEPRLRRLALNVYLRRGPTVARNEILSFLADDDDGVRELAVVGVARFADKKTLLDQYIKVNDKQPKYQLSVDRARFLLKK